MIIVNQDKDMVINFDNVYGIYVEATEESNIMAMLDGQEWVIGKYKTEERAKEVLQEIIRAYVTDRKVKETDNFWGYTIMQKDIYYEMPLE